MAEGRRRTVHHWARNLLLLKALLHSFQNPNHINVGLEVRCWDVLILDTAKGTLDLNVRQTVCFLEGQTEETKCVATWKNLGQIYI